MRARLRLRLLVRLGVLAFLAASLPGCSLVSGAQGGYRLTAYFPKAVAFYSQSKVKLMGLNVGQVDSVKIDGNQVRVVFTVRNNIPLPADVHAAIFPLSIIGERNLTLFPPWKAGLPLAHNGDVIPPSRTQVPIEVDDILKSVTDLAHALNPNDVRSLVSSAAKTLQGHGQDVNAALQQVSGLTGTLAEQDQQLVQVANNIHQLASTLNSRQQELGAVIDAFSQATGVLASERRQLTRFLTAIVQLSQQGQLLIQGLQQQLPADIANLAKVVMTVQVNAAGLSQFLDTLPHVATVVIESFNPTFNLFQLRFDLSQSAKEILTGLINSLGLPNLCIPLPGATPCR
jgi:virulence factor Mce-like protein